MADKIGDINLQGMGDAKGVGGVSYQRVDPAAGSAGSRTTAKSMSDAADIMGSSASRIGTRVVDAYASIGKMVIDRQVAIDDTRRKHEDLSAYSKVSQDLNDTTASILSSEMQRTGADAKGATDRANESYHSMSKAIESIRFNDPELRIRAINEIKKQSLQTSLQLQTHERTQLTSALESSYSSYINNVVDNAAKVPARADELASSLEEYTQKMAESGLLNGDKLNDMKSAAQRKIQESAAKAEVHTFGAGRTVGDMQAGIKRIDEHWSGRVSAELAMSLKEHLVNKQHSLELEQKALQAEAERKNREMLQIELGKARWNAEQSGGAVKETVGALDSGQSVSLVDLKKAIDNRELSGNRLMQLGDAEGGLRIKKEVAYLRQRVTDKLAEGEIINQVSGGSLSIYETKDKLQNHVIKMATEIQGELDPTPGAPKHSPATLAQATAALASLNERIKLAEKDPKGFVKPMVDKAFSQQLQLMESKGEGVPVEKQKQLYANISYQFQVMTFGKDKAMPLSEDEKANVMSIAKTKSAEDVGKVFSQIHASFPTNAEARKKAYEQAGVDPVVVPALEGMMKLKDRRVVGIVGQAMLGNYSESAFEAAALYTKKEGETSEQMKTRVADAKAYAAKETSNDEMMKTLITQNGFYAKNADDIVKFKGKLESAVAFGHLHGVDVLGELKKNYTVIKSNDVTDVYGWAFGKSPEVTDKFGGKASIKHNFVFHGDMNVSQAKMSYFFANNSGAIAHSLVGLNNGSFEKDLLDASKSSPEVAKMRQLLGISGMKRESSGAITVEYAQHPGVAGTLEEIGALFKPGVVTKDPQGRVARFTVSEENAKNFINNRKIALSKLISEYGEIVSTPDNAAVLKLDVPGVVNDFIGRQLPFESTANGKGLKQIAEEFDKNTLLSKAVNATKSAVDTYQKGKEAAKQRMKSPENLGVTERE